MSSGRLLVVLVLSTLVACGDDPEPPDSPGPSLPNLSIGESTVGAPFSKTLAAFGGHAPFVYSAQGLPGGIALDTQNGILTGSPTSAGTFDITLTVTDADSRSDQRRYPLLVHEAPRFLTTSLPPASISIPYAVRIEIAGGKAPLAYGFGGGSPPPGFTLDASGTLSANPAVVGTYSFEISITDAHGAVKRAPFTLLVRNAPPVIVTPALPPALVSVPYQFSFLATGGTPPYTWTRLVGSLPIGFGLSSSGELSGTSPSSGTFFFTLGLRDASGQALQKEYSLTVNSQVILTTAALPDAYRGTPYSTSVEASGGAPPYTYSLVSSPLPAACSSAARAPCPAPHPSPAPSASPSVSRTPPSRSPPAPSASPSTSPRASPTPPFAME